MGFSGSSSFIAVVVLLSSRSPLVSLVSDVVDGSMGATTLSMPENSNQCERNIVVQGKEERARRLLLCCGLRCYDMLWGCWLQKIMSERAK